MSKPLTYKGYAAHVEFDAEDRIFFGRLVAIADIVTFHGETVEELVRAFEKAVDSYVAMSKKLGRPPQKPFSGKLLLRVPPALHAHIATMAEANGKSINAWATEMLSRVE